MIWTSRGASKRFCARRHSLPNPTSGGVCSRRSSIVVGAVHALELDDPPPSTVALAEETALQGQDLFYPPNVGGWPGGRSWLEPRALVRRATSPPPWWADSCLVAARRSPRNHSPLVTISRVTTTGHSGFLKKFFSERERDPDAAQQRQRSER